MSHGVILNELTGVPEAIVEDYLDMEWSRVWSGAGSFTLHVNRYQLGAANIRKGALFVPDIADLPVVYEIGQIESMIEADGRPSDTLAVTGKSLDSLFEWRIANPPDGETYDAQIDVPAETAIKHYVYMHAGAGADADRQVSNLVIAGDQARGDDVSYQARFQKVSQVLLEIGTLRGMGYDITLDLYTLEYIFDVIVGVDRSDSVYFDTEFETVQSQRWLSSNLDMRNFAYVAGQGEGVDRVVVERYYGASVPTGLQRREEFVDARDLTTVSALRDRGDAKLQETQFTDRFAATINHLAGFQYRTHWDLGDIISIRNRQWGIEQAARIVTVTQRLTPAMGAPQISVEIDKPWPSLQERVEQTVPTSTVDYASGGTVGGGPFAPDPHDSDSHTVAYAPDPHDSDSHTTDYAPEVHEHDAEYVNVTGDTMTGDLTMNNTEALLGKNVAGVAQNLAVVTAADHAALGDLDLPLDFYSNGDPFLNSSYRMAHAGNFGAEFILTGAGSPPAAGVAGRLYFRQDTGEILRDTGVVWVTTNLNAATAYLINRSGGAVAAGDAVVRDSANDASFKTSTTAGDQLVIGVAMEAILNGNAGRIMLMGDVPWNVPASGAIARGDFVRHSGTAKTVVSAGTTAVPGVFGWAKAAASGGTVSRFSLAWSSGSNHRRTRAALARRIYGCCAAILARSR
jgi:hypothetical protein